MKRATKIVVVLALCAGLVRLHAQRPSSYELIVNGSSTSFQTLGDLKAFVAALQEPVPQPQPAPVPEPEPVPEPDPAPSPQPPTKGWPTLAQLPTKPLPCWTTGDGCYPEPRNFIEAQWHEAPNNNLDQARHIHVGAAFPRVFKGIVRLDVRVQAFHWQGGEFDSIRKALIRVDGYRRVLPEPRKRGKPGLYKVNITQHLQEFYIPIYFDVTHAESSGLHLLEIDAGFLNPDGHDSAVRLQVPIVIDNGRPVKPGNGGQLAVEGWTSINDSNPFGYLRLSAPATRRFESDPVGPVDVFVNGREHRSLSIVAMVNPDLHAHPPDYGTVLLDQQGLMDRHGRAVTKRVFQPALRSGDRMMFRVGDDDPAHEPDGAGAALLIVSIGKG